VDTYLTIADPSNLCSTLYQLSNTKRWLEDAILPRTCGARYHVCVTDTADADNGSIDTKESGYYLAAYVLSGGEDLEFGGKNSSNNREYEMSSNPYDVDANRDDLVGELSFGEMMAKICNDKNTTIVVESSGKLGRDFSSCNTSVPASPPALNVVTVSLGRFVYYGSTCSNEMIFNDLAKCDAGFSVTDCTAGAWYDREVEL